MTAQTFHDINQVIAKLDSLISSARYGQSRSGMIPPEALAQIISDVHDASATLSDLVEADSTIVPIYRGVLKSAR